MNAFPNAIKEVFQNVFKELFSFSGNTDIYRWSNNEKIQWSDGSNVTY